MTKPLISVMGTVVPQPPPLTGNVDPTKIEEIRRTVYVGNLSTKVPYSSLEDVFPHHYILLSLCFASWQRSRYWPSFNLVERLDMSGWLEMKPNPLGIYVHCIWHAYTYIYLIFFQSCGEVRYVIMAGDEHNPLGIYIHCIWHVHVYTYMEH